MNFRDIGFVNAINEEPPDCVLREGLEQHLPNLKDFSSAVLALTFDSGPSENPTARSYVFHFFRGQADPNRRPDDILTFKIRFDDPFKVHIIDKYLGGVSSGAENAPALAHRHLWRPGLMSKEGKESLMKGFSETEAEKQKSGCFIATAAFGTPLAKEVQYLSQFRDEILEQNAFGRFLIQLYYGMSPRLGRLILGRAILQWGVCMLLIRPAIRLYLMMTTKKEH